jgi:hypothetical protein
MKENTESYIMPNLLYPTEMFEEAVSKAMSANGHRRK